MDQQNPISIVFVLAAMGLMFLGMMQYLVAQLKSNETGRQKLVDENIALKNDKADLINERDELKVEVEKYKTLVRKYYAFAHKLQDENDELKRGATKTIQTVKTETIAPPSEPQNQS